MNNKRRTTIKDIYDQSPLKERISFKEYKQIWREFAKTLVEELLTTGNAYKLPSAMGVMQIRKKKTKSKKKVVDFQKTKEYGMTIYHNNKHSDGYYAMYFWDREFPKAVFKNKKIFQLEITRANKRKLAKYVKNNITLINKYFELT